MLKGGIYAIKPDGNGLRKISGPHQQDIDTRDFPRVTVTGVLRNESTPSPGTVGLVSWGFLDIEGFKFKGPVCIFIVTFRTYQGIYLIYFLDDARPVFPELFASLLRVNQCRESERKKHEQYKRLLDFVSVFT